LASVLGADALIRRLHAIGEAHPVLRVWQIETVAEGKRTVRRKTGHLGRSIVPGSITRDTASVEARTPYAATIEKGSRPHIIKPRKAKVLAWGGSRRLSGKLRKGSRATNFAMIVHHPGTKPYPFLLPAAKKAAGRFRDAVVKAWNSAA
jgi:hypothetical protein